MVKVINTCIAFTRSSPTVSQCRFRSKIHWPTLLWGHSHDQRVLLSSSGGLPPLSEMLALFWAKLSNSHLSTHWCCLSKPALGGWMAVSTNHKTTGQGGHNLWGSVHLRCEIMWGFVNPLKEVINQVTVYSVDSDCQQLC